VVQQQGQGQLQPLYSAAACAFGAAVARTTAVGREEPLFEQQQPAMLDERVQLWSAGYAAQQEQLQGLQQEGRAVCDDAMAPAAAATAAAAAAVSDARVPQEAHKVAHSSSKVSSRHHTVGGFPQGKDYTVAAEQHQQDQGSLQQQQSWVVLPCRAPLENTAKEMDAATALFLDPAPGVMAGGAAPAAAAAAEAATAAVVCVDFSECQELLAAMAALLE